MRCLADGSQGLASACWWDLVPYRVTNFKITSASISNRAKFPSNASINVITHATTRILVINLVVDSMTSLPIKNYHGCCHSY